ncbi:MAG: TauD/TfdA family dioxygenase, partial [Gammaproteobacteria bacterium]|nr:TauD/TfdA family dioxygenase [Gammaproteobacteria bacterium]
PSGMRDRARTIRLKHDAAHDSVGRLRRGHRHASSPLEAPGALHPMVRPHPENGTEALFLGRRQDAYVEGLPLAESEAFLDEVWRYVARPDATWTQQWRVGDLLIWDNRSVMHRRAAFDPNARRLMRRTQVRPS